MLAYLFVSFLRNIRRLWRRFLMGLHIKNMHGLLTARKRGSENRPSFRFSCSLQKPHTSDKFLKPEVSLTCLIQQMSNKKRQNFKNLPFQSVDKDGCGTIVPQPIFLFLNYAAANKPENRLNTGPIIPFLCSILASFFKLRHA